MDKITDAFDARWNSGERPDIADFLVRVSESQRAELLRQLIPIDVEYRRKCGDVIDPADYQKRFPELAVDIMQWLGNDQTQPGLPIVRILPTRLVKGARLGNYVLVEQIGQGGMGDVWSADQVSPMQRQVALKLIRPDLCYDESMAQQTLARFEAERQSMALMNHPNIACIFDAGTTDSGQPYFVMELVRGRPLTTFCNDNDLSFIARLSLVEQICLAVQHAHQKGLIHRDLKPSNILVSGNSDNPTVKIIDFGLAKVTSSSVHRALFRDLTELGQALGTLKYMSPEQASRHNSDVDTRTDIYSLGVILYELLVGETPLDSSGIIGKAHLALLEAIRDMEPVRPSSRIESVYHSGAQSGLCSNSDMQSIKNMLLGDLDWIAVKALENDRERRYESAAALASDIRRFLEQKPIEARPPNFTYQLRKSYLRNRGRYWFAMLVLAMTVAGLASTTFLWRRAVLAEQQSSKDAETAIGYANEANLARSNAEALAQSLRTQSFRNCDLLTNLTSEMLDSGVLENSETIFLEAHRSTSQLYGPTSEKTLQSQLRFATYYLEVGEFDKANDMLMEVEQAISSFQKDRLQLNLDFLRELSRYNLKVNHKKAATQTLQQRIRLCEANRVHDELGDALVSLGSLQFSDSEYLSALSSYEQAAAALQAALAMRKKDNKQPPHRDLFDFFAGGKSKKHPYRNPRDKLRDLFFDSLREQIRIRLLLRQYDSIGTQLEKQASLVVEFQLLGEGSFEEEFAKIFTVPLGASFPLEDLMETYEIRSRYITQRDHGSTKSVQEDLKVLMQFSRSDSDRLAREALSAIGIIYFRSGDIVEAESYLRQASLLYDLDLAFSMYDEWPEIAAFLAMTLYTRGETAEATELADKFSDLLQNPLFTNDKTLKRISTELYEISGALR